MRERVTYINMARLWSTTAHLSVAELGIYFFFVMYCAMHDDVIPRDDASLRRIGHCSRHEWNRHKDIILDLFEVVDEHRLRLKFPPYRKRRTKSPNVVSIKQGRRS